MAQVANVAEQAAYFVFEQSSPEGLTKQFVFKLIDPAKIAEARAIVAEGRRNDSVQGTVIQRQVPYNPYWSFHLAPNSIGFFEWQIEVCDANVTYVEAHLEEVGGSFLPRSFWCPWSSKLVSEVTERIDEASEVLLR